MPQPPALRARPAMAPSEAVGSLTRGPSPVVGAWEGLLVRGAGLRDRWRCRDVADVHPTHWVHELHARVQARETDVIRWAEADLARLDRELAVARLIASTSQPAETSSPVEVAEAEAFADAEAGRADGVPDAARMMDEAVAGSVAADPHLSAARQPHLVAVERRAARAARDAARRRAASLAAARAARAAEARAARERRREAEQRCQEILAEREGVLHLLADLREQCREAFEVRAARYTRARSGWLGLTRTTRHQVPAYHPAPDPAGQRAPLSVIDLRGATPTGRHTGDGQTHPEHHHERRSDSEEQR